MNEVLFVGERRSDTAKRMGVRWEDRALASKQLHDAFDAIGFDSLRARFINICTPGAAKVVYAHKGTIVGMGAVAQLWLAKRGIVHRPMIHPAARGKIRAKATYAAHVDSVLRPDKDVT
jgi:hypothetical protein